MDQNIAIKVDGLTKIYPIYNNKNDRMKEALSLTRKKYHTEFHALNNISFEIKKGETVGIIGQNGSGKSTLLKILTGVLSPSSGNVEVNGKVSALLELGAGFNPEMTGIENIYLNGTIMGYTKEEMNDRIPQIVEFADIGEFINQPVKMYSSGMFVRLAFAVAINVEPDILIVDEALSVGDMAFQAKCITKMAEIIEKGVTVFFVSHEIETIKSLCKRCVYLKDGKVVLDGNPPTVTEAYICDLREKMNGITVDFKKNITAKNKYKYESPKELDEELLFAPKDLALFAQKVAMFREGLGDVKVIYAEILDMQDADILVAQFDQKVKIRIYVEFFKERNIAIGYHIRDHKNINLLGSGTFVEIKELIKGSPQNKIMAEFITTLPLTDGNYNISIIVSEPVATEQAVFLDVVKNAILFKVQKPNGRKVWDKVHLKNDVTIVNYKGSHNV